MATELSVVIATRNRSEMLRRCLEALANQTEAPENFEVVIADDGSSDGSTSMLQELVTPFALQVLELDHVGRAAARNAAIEASQGAICLIFDDDIIASPPVVAEHLEAHRGEERVLGIGMIEQGEVPGRDWFAHAYVTGWNRHYRRVAEKGATWRDGYGANLSARRSDLVAIGGFTLPALPTGQDIELSFRLARHRCVPRFLPQARAVHENPKGRRALLAESRLQGASSVAQAEREPQMLGHLLGWFAAATPREVMLRRAMIALRVPPALLARLGSALPGEGRKEIWFDFVRRVAMWRGVRRAVDRVRWTQLTRGVPVLMYHAFDERVAGERYVISRRRFAVQMRLLALLRYQVIRFEELAQGLRAGRLPPPRAAVITIDDGYLDNLTVALPVLRRRRFPATIFLVSRRLGTVADWASSPSINQRPLLSAEQIKSMRGELVDFGAHTRTHIALAEAPDTEVREEIGGSKTDLEEVLGRPVATLAYPYGSYDERAMEAAEEAGFIGAGTTEPRLVRLSDPPQDIPRIEIRGTDSLRRFVWELRFGLR